MQRRFDKSAAIEELAQRALVGISREYPSHIQHLLHSDDDVAPPQMLHPAFFGCFDWHSAVHTHWLLVRLLNTVPASGLRDKITEALGSSFEPGKLRVESQYLAKRGSFERPYGLAWLLQLAAELADCNDVLAGRWSGALQPLAAVARRNLLDWLQILRYPVRSGTHNQTAFAFTLLLDSAHVTGDRELAELVTAHTLAFFNEDAVAPLRFEPSGEDFFSPSLMEADLLRRALSPADFHDWLGRFLPNIPADDTADWLPCAEVADETDDKSVHLHGLNLSRAWNLGNIAAALPETDPRVPVLMSAAERHRDAGLDATLASTHYAATHWLPTFAVYLLTQGGQPESSIPSG